MPAAVRLILIQKNFEYKPLTTLLIFDLSGIR